MPLPQEIRPLHQDLQDTLFRASDSAWIENSPGLAWTRVLWTGSESGTWAAVFRWKKGFVACPRRSALNRMRFSTSFPCCLYHGYVAGCG